MATKKSAAKKATATTTKLSPQQKEKLEVMGITAANEAEARKKLIAILEKNDIVGVEEDELDTLIDMCSVLETAEEEELEEAEEAPKPAKKATGKKKVEVEEEEVDEDVEEEEEEEEEAEEEVEEADPEELDMADMLQEVASKKISTKRAAPAKPAKQAKAGKKQTRKRRLSGTPWQNLKKAEQAKAMEAFKKIAPESKFAYKVILKGFTVAYLGNSSAHNIFKLNRVHVLENGQLEASFSSNRFKTTDKLKPYLADIDMSNKKVMQGDSSSYVYPITQKEIMQVLKSTTFVKDSIELATKQDVKMQKNREKLEKDLSSEAPAKTAKAKAAVKKAPAAPAKKVVAKAAPAKKAAAKKAATKKVVVKRKK